MWLIDIQTNEWLIVGLIEWSIQHDSNPIQFYQIWSNSSLVAVIIQLFSLFIVYSELFLFNEAKSMSYFNLNDCIALSTCLQWIPNGIIIKYRSIRTIPLCHYQFHSSWLSEAISLLSILNNPRSNHYLVMIGRLQPSSFVNVQYMIVGSLVIKSIIIIFELNGWLIETTILIQYHCKNRNEKQHYQADRTDILIIIESCMGSRIGLKQTNNHSIQMFLINDESMNNYQS